MRKFPGYPIVINYNVHTQELYEDEEESLHKAGRYVEERQLVIKSVTTSDADLGNNLYRQEMNKYEVAIWQCLRKIEGNPVGRMVIGLINKRTKVWIIPKSEHPYDSMTGPLNYDIQWDGSYARGAGSGDTVIQVIPESGDDVLFHELVHACRYSYNRFDPIKIFLQTVPPEPQRIQDQSSEEFLAHHMQNIYLSLAHRTLVLDYHWNSDATKKEIYDFLRENNRALGALKYFLRHEYMARLAAHCLSAAYNPFRDYAMLEAEYVKEDTSPEFPQPTVSELGKGVGEHQ